jgi:two-component system LytT family response regulator
MTAIIIDDEKRARVSLALLVKEFYPSLEIVAECENLPQGVKAIRKLKPNLVFLDIEMPGHSGLELLEFFDENEVTFDIIFTTAYNEYALKAFKFSAIDYLLKPINPDELVDALKRLEKQKLKLENYKVLQENIKQETLNKIAVPSGNRILFIETLDIIYIKGEGAYAEIFCQNNIKHLVSRNLKNFEDILCFDNRFIRVHKSYIVNMSFCNSFHKSDGGSLILKNGQNIPISTEKATSIIDYFSMIKR